MNTATATGSQAGRGGAVRASRDAQENPVTRRINPSQAKPAQARTIRAPRGNERVCKSWAAEAAMRMLMNNLDPEVAERPQDLVVYGGRGQAARNWESFHAITDSLKKLRPAE